MGDYGLYMGRGTDCRGAAKGKEETKREEERAHEWATVSIWEIVNITKNTFGAILRPVSGKNRGHFIRAQDVA